MTRNTGRAVIAAALGLLLAAPAARAVDIDVANYGTGLNSVPFAIAQEKGFFKDAGVDIASFIGSTGGGSDVRQLVAGELPYAESSMAGVISAIQQGVDLKIIGENSQTATGTNYVAMANSPVNSIKDLKGRKVGFSSPQSLSQAVILAVLQKAGYWPGDVQTVSAGGFGPGMTLLEHGGIDVMPFPEPGYTQTLDSGKYKTVIRPGEFIHPMCTSFAITTSKVIKEHPDTLRGIIAGRRKAVQFMSSNRSESAAIAAKLMKLDPALMARILNDQLDHGTVEGIPVFGQGEFHYDCMDNAVTAFHSVGVLTVDKIDWSKIVDESLLPADLKSKT